jgi:hypothetical protein
MLEWFREITAKISRRLDKRKIIEENLAHQAEMKKKQDFSGEPVEINMDKHPLSHLLEFRDRLSDRS